MTKQNNNCYQEEVDVKPQGSTKTVNVARESGMMTVKVDGIPVDVNCQVETAVISGVSIRVRKHSCFMDITVDAAEVINEGGYHMTYHSDNMGGVSSIRAEKYVGEYYKVPAH